MSNKDRGTKDDKGKPDLSLNPKAATWGMARALTYGANKYGRYNFKKGIEYTRLSAACMRHLTAFLEGEDIDSESGNHHVHHALASLAMLADMIENRPEMDDRYKKHDDTHRKHIEIQLELERELRKRDNGY